MTLPSTTKTVTIEAPVSKVFSFLADVTNWPQWAVVNVMSVAPTDDNWWRMRTPNGVAKIRLHPDERLGILDHEFNTIEARWLIPARVIANGSGSLFMITIFHPPAFTNAFFDCHVASVDKELAVLKELMER